MDGFSGILRLTDLDDFLAPSQECIKPMLDQLERQKSAGAVRRTTIAGDVSAEKTSKEKATISLHDCLACSGCVTSAEAVLIEEQSYVKLIERLQEKSDDDLVVVSISPQSRSSIANYRGWSAAECAGRMSGFLRQLGVDLIFDLTEARQFSLFESACEFGRRLFSASTPGNTGRPTVLTSACPGFVCFAEKTHGSWILPYVSEVKSPQAMMGTILHAFIAKKFSSGKTIYHATVMPCFDKKLEASRKQLCGEVNLVISTLEFQQMMDEYYSTSEDTLRSSKLNSLMEFCTDAEPYGSLTLKTHSGGGSGGFAEYIIHFLIAHFGAQLLESASENTTIQWVKGRNKDISESKLKVTIAGQEQQLTFCRAYGFRNLQNITQKLKQGRLNYQFVEVMACPSGCLNGGGQLRPSPQMVVSKFLQDLTNSYYDVELINETVPAGFEKLYRDWLRPNVDNLTELALFDSKAPSSRLLTSYEAVAKRAATSIKW